jgi:hypothetical protein
MPDAVNLAGYATVRPLLFGMCSIRPCVCSSAVQCLVWAALLAARQLVAQALLVHPSMRIITVSKHGLKMWHRSPVTCWQLQFVVC